MNIDDKHIQQTEKQFLHYFSILMKMVTILFLFGLIGGKPNFLMEFNFVLKIIIAAYLIYRFNDYRQEKVKFTELDRNLVYSSSIYIILLSFADILFAYIHQIHDFFTPYTQPIIQAIKNKIIVG
jgi:hypothetical protein